MVNTYISNPVLLSTLIASSVQNYWKIKLWGKKKRKQTLKSLNKKSRTDAWLAEVKDLVNI
jgi:hypothetical protein